MESLVFSYANRHYYLQFNFLPIIQLKGYTASGKSLFVHDFGRIRKNHANFKNSLIVNSRHPEGLQLIKHHKYDYVIIDNADILITPDLDAYIFYQVVSGESTKYIIIGRRNYSCVATLSGVGALRCQQNEETGEFYFSVDYATTF